MLFKMQIRLDYINLMGSAHLKYLINDNNNDNVFP